MTRQRRGEVQKGPTFQDRGVQVTPLQPEDSGLPGPGFVVVPRWMVVLFVVSVASYAGLTAYHVLTDTDPQPWQVSPEMMEDLGEEGVMMFRAHDRNDDGVLSMEEFEPLAHRLSETNETYNYEQPIEEWDEIVTVETFFKPLLMETMTKNFKDEGFIPGSLDAFQGLKRWRHAMVDWQNYGASHLRSLMPPDPYMLEYVGKPYDLIPMPAEADRGAVLSSNRYHPPRLFTESEQLIHRLLNMFHPRPFLRSRFAPQGSLAVIRAVNKRYVDIVFRIHAEFQLNEPPYYPYWFTPAQFTGNIIISKDGGRVLAFRMYVPTKMQLNVDMEWIIARPDGDNLQVEVDIGFLPQMELKATRSSVPMNYAGVDTRELYVDTTPDYAKSLDEVKWTSEITLEEAERLLEIQMYPFKQVPYHNFTKAFDLAKNEKKLVHSILLWGALDDQSC